MVLKDFKVKAVEALINNFNAECDDEKYGRTININGVFHCNTNSIELDSGLVCVMRSINNSIIVTGSIPVEDVKNMYYIDEEYNTVSLGNIEF